MHIFIWKIPFFIYTLEFGQENRIFSLPEAFCGLKHAENAIAAAAPPRTPLESSRRSPDSLVGWGGDTLLPIPDPTRRLWRVDARAFGASIVVPPWHQILATPLVTTTFYGKVAPVERPKFQPPPLPHFQPIFLRANGESGTCVSLICRDPDVLLEH